MGGCRGQSRASRDEEEALQFGLVFVESALAPGVERPRLAPAPALGGPGRPQWRWAGRHLAALPGLGRAGGSARAPHTARSSGWASAELPECLGRQEAAWRRQGRVTLWAGRGSTGTFPVLQGALPALGDLRCWAHPPSGQERGNERAWSRCTAWQGLGACGSRGRPDSGVTAPWARQHPAPRVAGACRGSEALPGGWHGRPSTAHRSTVQGPVVPLGVPPQSQSHLLKSDAAAK